MSTGWIAIPMGVTGSDDLTPTLEPSSKKRKRNILEGDIDINTRQYKGCQEYQAHEHGRHT